MLINDQLSDEILVSVIASDFDHEVDFSKQDTIIPPEQTNVSDAIVPEQPAQEEPKEELQSDEDIDFLPGWLKK